MSEGIDVSHYQGKINWNKVANAGVRFAFIKASEGFTWKDSKFKTNWRAAKKVGISVGAYHFFRTKDGKRQAKNLLDRLEQVSYETGDLLPVIDLETWDPSSASRSTFVSYIEDWIETVEAEIGKKPIIYTFKSFWRRIGDPEHFSTCPLWVVDLSSNSKPRLPVGWNDFVVRQYDHHGSIQGIKGDVDLNSLKNASAFKKIIL